MKRIGFIMTLFFIVSSFTARLAAQENLDALVKKCETMDSVDINYVRAKDEKTKKLETKIINITIKNNQALINQFLEAFKKDEINANNVIEDKKGGRIISLFYQFADDTYSFTSGTKDFRGLGHEKAGYAVVTVLKGPKGKNASK